MRFLNNIEDYICRFLLTLFVTLLFVQVVLRTVFGWGLPWIEELSRFAFVWFAFLGAAHAAKLNAHNRVEVHLKLLPKRVYQTIIMLADLLWIAFNIAIVWKSWEVIEGLLEFPYISPALEWSMAYVYMIFPIAFVLLSFRTLQVDYHRFIKGEDIVDADQAEIDEVSKTAAETR